MKLLIVDDHPAMRRLIGRVVCDMVSEIEECSDGAEALATYQRFLPDWVLMDIEMDQVDGITAMREILLSYPRARVVIISKYDDDQTREAARKAGAGQPTKISASTAGGRPSPTRRSATRANAFPTSTT